MTTDLSDDSAERTPASTHSRRPPRPGDPAPDFELRSTHGAVTLATLRGTPVVLTFEAPGWNPARAEFLAECTRTIAAVPRAAGARLIALAESESWRFASVQNGEANARSDAGTDTTGDDEPDVRHSLGMDASVERQRDDVAAIPLIVGDATVAARYGVSGESAVFVIDGCGRVRWSHVMGGDVPAHPSEIARALATLLPGEDETAPPATAIQNCDESERVISPMPAGVSGLAADPYGWTRRDFLAAALGMALVMVLTPRHAAASTARAMVPLASGNTERAITLRVNGRDIPLSLDTRVTLLDALREHAGLTGTKKGCDHGQCGACTVHIAGRRVLSCLTLAVMAGGQEITTIEGLAPAATSGAGGGDGSGEAPLHPMQQAFIAHDGFQCGYCTSGQIMSAVAVTVEPWGPSDADVREAMSGNICRCGAYPGIVAAVQAVRHGGAAPTPGLSSEER